jgi:serine/threonine-protein kinase
VVESYKVLALLGQGGMGAVYLVEDTQTFNKRYALKELLDYFTNPQEQAEALQLFGEEARTLVHLSHLHLPQVTRYFSHNRRQYLLMEYIEGQTLEQLLLQNNRPLPEAEVKGWVLQLCNVLTYLHQQKPPIIFRDLKPANIMLNKDGVIKLIDFGIARMFDPKKTTDTLKMGSVGYASPEQHAGQGQTDARSDVYSLGATMHHLLTGHSPTVRPFAFQQPRQLNPKLSSRISQVIMKAVQMDPDQRYQTVQSLRAELEGPFDRIPPIVLGIMTMLFGLIVMAMVGGLTWTLLSPPAPVMGGVATALPTANFVTATPIVATTTPIPVVVATTESQPVATQPLANQVTPFATATPLPTFTAAAIAALPSPILLPTSTPLPAIAATPTPLPPPPSATPNERATMTPTPPLQAQSITPPQPKKPFAGMVVSEGIDGSFEWSWGSQLLPNQGFEIRIWQGDEEHYGAYGAIELQRVIRTEQRNNETIYLADIRVESAYSIQQHGSGEYTWSVAVVQLEPYQRIGAEGPALTFTYAQAGGGGGGKKDTGGGGGGGPNLDN